MSDEDLTYEPLRPSQRQVAITEQLTGVSLDVEICAICSNNRGVGDHHVIFRSRGGTAGPTLPACVRCHDTIHRGDWKLKLLKDRLEIRDLQGEVIWRLQRWPFGGDAGQFVQLLDRVSDVEKLMPDIAPALLPWQAVQVFESLRIVSDGGWRAQMRLIGEFYTYRMPGRTSPEKIEALCNLFRLRRSQVYNHIGVVQAFGESPVVEETSLGMGYLIEAARSEKPKEWLQFAEERKHVYPSFSRDDLRKEIERAGARRYQPPEEKAGPPAPVRIWGQCPHCKYVGYIEKLPIGSDGEPVQMEELGEGDRP